MTGEKRRGNENRGEKKTPEERKRNIRERE